MKKYLYLLLLSFSGMTLAQAATMAEYVQAADQCQNLQCVRANLDNIDSKMIALLGERLAYVQRAGQLKGRSQSTHDRGRELAIFDKVTQQAQQIGYPPEIARIVFGTILFQSNLYEQRTRQ